MCNIWDLSIYIYIHPMGEPYSVAAPLSYFALPAASVKSAIGYRSLLHRSYFGCVTGIYVK